MEATAEIGEGGGTEEAGPATTDEGESGEGGGGHTGEAVQNDVVGKRG